MKNEKIAVVGAGLVGSLIAKLLCDQGYIVELFERRSDMREERISAGKSINLAMSDRGLKALSLAGLDKAVKQLAIPMPGRLIHHSNGDQAFQAYSKSGKHINSVSRGGLNMLLMDEAENAGAHIYFQHTCEEVDFDKGTIDFTDGFGKKVQVKADVILGTDGAFSAVRACMQKTNLFNYSQYYTEHGYKELSIPAGPKGSFLIEKNALHIWPRSSFMLIALPNLDSSFTCTLFAPFTGKNSFEEWQDEKSVKAFFAREFPDALALMPELVEEFFGNPLGNLVTIKCAPWNRGKALLLGDASHAIVPFYGQGMNAGFEDCTLLMELLEREQHDWKKVLEIFGKDRLKDANAIADLAFQNFTEMRDHVGDPKFLYRKQIEHWIGEKYPKYISVYEMVTFSHLPYSFALEQMKKREEILEKLSSIDDIQTKWADPIVSKLVESLIS